LIIIRFLLGISIGGIVPLRIAYIRQQAPLSMQGEVLGYNTSLRFLGNVIGPAFGGMISGWYGCSAVFFVTSGLLLASGCRWEERRVGKEWRVGGVRVQDNREVERRSG